MHQPLPSRAWDENDALKAAREALVVLGKSGHSLQLLRLGENAIYHVNDTDLVLRVARPGTSSLEILRSIEIASLMSTAGIPVAEPAVHAHADEPMVFDDGVVSVWKYYQQHPGLNVDFREFGRLLRNLHLNSGPQIEDMLPRWDPFTVTRHRLQESDRRGAPEYWVRELTDRCDLLELEMLTHRPRLPEGAVHGDAHGGNLIRTSEKLVLLDLDTLCFGPRDLDFIPTLVQRRRFLVTDADWLQFMTAYGIDDYKVFDKSPLIRLRELTMVVWLLQQYGIHADIDRQLEHRIATLDDGVDGPVSWTAR